ncbi:MAG: PQQ-binding-like beta-propeller repeat protein, partial [Croceimicrobium sp.]
KRRNQLAYVYGHNGFIYTSRQISSKTSVVLRSPINQKNWKTLYSFTPNGAMEPFFGAFGFGELPNGDDIVLWQNRSGTPLDRVEIFAYNISADTLLWRNRDFIGFDTPSSPRVYNGKVFGRFIGSIYCLDIETGETIWIKDYENSFENSFLPFGISFIGIFNDQLIALPNRGKILYLNPKNGNISNAVDGYPDGSGEGVFSEYQGKLYFTSSYQLVVTDIATGENLATPAKLGELNDIDIYSSITVDPESGKLYFQDGYYLYCVKQPKNL